MVTSSQDVKMVISSQDVKMVTSSQGVWLRHFEAALDPLPSDQRQIVRRATADFIEAVVPVLQEVSENGQRNILRGLSNLILVVVPHGASRKVKPENVDAHAPIYTVLNQLRADPPRAR
jgi:hypothetical protein